MATRKNPIDQVKDVAIEALKNPKGAAEKAVGTARETAAIGRMVAGQVGRIAVSRAGELAGDVLSRASGRRTGSQPKPVQSSAPVADPDAPQAGTSSPAGIAEKTAKVPSSRVPAEDTEGPAPDEKAPATKAAAKKAPAKKAPTKKAPTKKAAAKKTTTSDVPTPAEVAENIAPAKKAPAKKTTKKATTKTPAEKSAPGDRLPAKKVAKKTAAPDPDEPNLPRTAAEVRDSDDVDVTTPVGTSAAGEGTNPDTAERDLQQPGTPPLLDPGTVHAVQSEAETLQKAADPDKG